MERQHELRHLRGVAPALVALMAVAAAAAAWVASRHGPLLSPDSVTYLSLARNLAAGKGYVDLTAQANTTFAPGFPAVMAAGHLVGLTASSTSRLVNVASYAALVVLAWVLVRRHTSSQVLALAATSLVVVSPALLDVSAHAWSEPLFCVVILGFILVLEEALSRSNRQRQLVLVVVAGLLAGIAFIVRYAGFTLLAVGVIVLLLSREATRTRMRNVAVFLVAASPLPAIWLLRNASSGARYLMGPRTSIPDSVSSLVQRFAESSVTMFVTHSSATRTRFLVLGPAVVLVVVGLVVALRRRKGPVTHSKLPSEMPLVTVIVVYGVAVVVSGKTAGSSIDLRIVMPIFIPVIVVGARFVSYALAAARDAPGNWARGGAYLLSIAVVLGVISTADGFVQTSWALGRTPHGYATDTLASSALARAVRVHTRSSAIVTTNSPWALYSATGHQPVFPTPGELYPSASLPPATSDMLADAACGQPVFFAWYERSRHPSTDLGHALRLTVVENVSDGVLYMVHAPSGECRADAHGESGDARDELTTPRARPASKPNAGPSAFLRAYG